MIVMEAALLVYSLACPSVQLFNLNLLQLEISFLLFVFYLCPYVLFSLALQNEGGYGKMFLVLQLCSTTVEENFCF